MIASSVIDASLTTQSLTFRPGGSSVAFGVSVVNRSDCFASFQLEILAAGATDQSHWYHLSPEVSTAKSPGDRTDFHIDILDTPIPNFVGTINLMVRVSSPQLLEERRLVLRLAIESGGTSNLLRIGLPVKRVQTYPRNQVEIPVTVRNLGSQPLETLVQCHELKADWILGSTAHHMAIAGHGEITTTFKCQPPGVEQALSREYPFTILARSREGFAVEAVGILEVLPVGFIHFEVQPRVQHIPTKRPWLPNWRSRSAAFQVLFKNHSNLLQKVDLEVRGQDVKRCNIQIDPEGAQLPLGELTPVSLVISPRRPWVGWVRQLKFEVKPWLTDSRLGSCDPATQTLRLKVFPIIPLWAFLACFATLAVAVFRPIPVSHMAGVNAVRLSGTSGRLPLVVSASDDCSIRSWGVTDHETLKPQGSFKGSSAKTCTSIQSASSKGLLALSQQAIRSLALTPVQNNEVFAGLENGTIQSWDLNTGASLYTLRDPTDQTSDRNLDLLLTRNSLTLYSSYGSGTIRSWQRSYDVRFPAKPANVLKLPEQFTFQAWSLALSPDERTLVSAGQFKRLILWNVSQSRPSPQQLVLPDRAHNRGENDFFWDANFAPKSPILAAADSDGYVTLWDLTQCSTLSQSKASSQKSSQKSPKESPKKFAQKPIQKPIRKPIQKPTQQLPQVHCAQRSRWQASKTSVRKVQFTPDQRWLVSAGDDGQITAWPLTPQTTFDPTHRPQPIATLPSRVTSLDLISDNQGVWIASGSEDAQVRLHRFHPEAR
jgi:WD40 repeat protein